VHRPLTPILPCKMCVHELIHGCCIDLCTQINFFVTPVEELCKAVTKICPRVYICVHSCRYYNKVYTQEAVQFNGHQWSLQACELTWRETIACKKAAAFAMVTNDFGPPRDDNK
jgi:hypothetical protein